MSAHTENVWYSKNIAHDTQSVIIHEQTGQIIAVVYDPLHSPIIAAAPALLKALKTLRGKYLMLYAEAMATRPDVALICQMVSETSKAFDDAIAQAEGKE